MSMAPLPVPMPTSIAWKVCDDFDGNNPAILDITEAGMLDLHDARRSIPPECRSLTADICR